MGYVMNISQTCKICGKKTRSGEDYCEDHKDEDPAEMDEEEKIDMF